MVSGEHDIKTGVWQGDELAPVLFNQFCDAVVAAIMLHALGLEGRCVQSGGSADGKLDEVEG